MAHTFSIDTNTAWFRLALSVAAIWLLAIGYNTYLFYVNLKTSAASAAQQYTQSQYEECSNDTLDMRNGQFMYRPSTFDEVRECRRSVDRGHALYEANRPIWDKLWDERSALEHFFYRGILPAGTLLLLVALWSKLKAAGRFYIQWIKNGSNNKQP